MIHISITQLTIIYAFVTIIFIIVLESKKLDYIKAKASCFSFFSFTIALFTFYFLQHLWNSNILFICLYIVFELVTILILKRFKLYKPIHSVLFIFLTFLAISLEYISYTPYFVRQHDMRDFYDYGNGGHFGYIGYLFANHHLPIGNPKDYWCFFNPPLFYIISAIFIKIQNLTGLKFEECFENLQFFSCFCTLIFDIYVYRILKKVGIKHSLTIVTAFVLFSPSLIIMSGSLNNDILSIMLSTMALFYAIKWFESDKLLDLIKIAFCIGIAMMTKVSSAIIAIAIGALFIMRLLKNRKEFKKYIIHFGIFAIIALPIGLWFPIKNLILYHIPPTYVQSVDPNTPINLSSYSVAERFFTVSSHEAISNVNVIMEGEHRDYNLFFTTLKSFVLDEHVDYQENQLLRFNSSCFILSIYNNSYNISS